MAAEIFFKGHAAEKVVKEAPGFKDFEINEGGISYG
jgi:hypothetical protein